MARPIRKTLAAAGVTPPIPMNVHIVANISISVVLAPTSTLTYSVEHTFDDVFAEGFDPDTATWFPNDVLTGQTASADGNYAFPVTAIRLNVSAFTSGSAAITVIQGGLRD